MTSQKNTKNNQRRNGVQKTKKEKGTKSNMQQTELIQKVHELDEQVRIMNMRLNAMSVKEVKPTKADLRAIAIGKKEIAEGKYITLDELRKKRPWK